MSNLAIKHYWRESHPGHRHCFVKNRDQGGYVSLCGRERIAKSGGQSCRRPPPMLRCGVCDIEEMRVFGWEASGPTHENWSTR